MVVSGGDDGGEWGWILMLASGTSIQKPFIVPIFALQAPASIISWIKVKYGVWTAFLALLISLFFHIPGELELPFNALLIVLVAPYQILNLRRNLEGIILSLTIAGFLTFQHFSRAGSLRKAFDQGLFLQKAISWLHGLSCFRSVENVIKSFEAEKEHKIVKQSGANGEMPISDEEFMNYVYDSSEPLVIELHLTDFFAGGSSDCDYDGRQHQR
ncbi:cold-regulated 413 inner membrane protein 1, chloroplastic-like [Apium graveolens]|uniref:cold-regulated 413 inner membrane protein 1, chloroplastic-like n=1 Tax=Apium graveolens TaxID=4045 RepID=UPI003D79CA84